MKDRSHDFVACIIFGVTTVIIIELINYLIKYN